MLPLLQETTGCILEPLPGTRLINPQRQLRFKLSSGGAIRHIKHSIFIEVDFGLKKMFYICNTISKFEIFLFLQF